MKHRVKNSQSGVALLSALFAVLLLSAIALGLVYVAGTESQVNYNYRNEQIAYFAAKAGIEEARDRMIYNTSNPNYYFGATSLLPTQLPPASGSVVYLLNEGSASGTVTPWTFQNNSLYPDDELCHDGYAWSGNLTQAPPDVRCTTTPKDNGVANGWYTTIASATPWNGTSAALAYKWVRIALKVNGTEQDYAVVNNGSTAQVCWNGQNETLLTAPATSCDQMQTAQQTSMTPVYVLTALAVAPSGARKMVQAEVARQPNQSFIYGMFADGTGCASLSLNGNGVTDSFTTANGGTYATTKSNTGGDVGSNGNVTLNGNAAVGGSIGVLPVSPAKAASQGPCPQNNYTDNAPNGGIVQNANNGLITLTQPVTFANPPAPNPAPQNTSYTPPSCGKGQSGLCMVPGTYGNINIASHTALTFAPGVYNINSISVTGQATLDINTNPPGQVVLNVAGNGFGAGTSPILLAGGSISNTTGIANDFQVIYGGTLPITVAGGSSAYMVVYAPNSALTLAGDADLYGAVLGNTILAPGNLKFHYDKNTKLTNVPSTGPLTMISYRDVSY